MKPGKKSTDLSKQQLSNKKGEETVKRTSSGKTREEELADKSEGFGGSAEELNQFRLELRDEEKKKK